jgi:hypothetical protein
MKLIITLLFFLIIIGLISCNKSSDDYRSIGIISGLDYTMCGCCGGWIIYIDSERYLFDSIPSNSKIHLEDEVLPITVKLDWQLISNGCPIKRITIQRIKKE